MLRIKNVFDIVTLCHMLTLKENMVKQRTFLKAHHYNGQCP